MRIDAHQHFWQYDPVRDSWITENMQVIRRDFTPTDLQPLLQAHQIDGCVAVQADQSDAETEYLLHLAQNHPWIKGVVGWLDLKATDLQAKLEVHRDSRQLKGYRHILQAEPKGFMSDATFVQGVTQVGQAGFCYDILTTENQLEEVVTFVKALPEMPLVVDHLSKPNIAEHSFNHWARYMELLSAHEQVHVKVSGMITEADWQKWTVEDLKPYIDFCLEHFGPKRMMYGSDWPVCLLAGEYQRVVEALQQCIGALSEWEQAAIYGATAAEFYKLDI